MNKTPGSDYNLVGPSLDWSEFVDVVCESFQIMDYALVSQVADFSFWDIEANIGMRTLTSEFDWLVKYPFTSLLKSLSKYLASV